MERKKNKNSWAEEAIVVGARGKNQTHEGKQQPGRYLRVRFLSANQLFRGNERRLMILNKAYDSMLMHPEPARRSAHTSVKKNTRYLVGKEDEGPRNEANRALQTKVCIRKGR